jgi:hypothetical protein
MADFADIGSVGVPMLAELAGVSAWRPSQVKTGATIGLVDAGDEPDERRKTPRFDCEGTGEVIVLGGALRFSGELCDLSGSGCRIATKVAFRLERGTRVEVAMAVNGVHFRVAGGVRSNHKTRGVGLEFMNVSLRGARLIQELIRELAAKAERDRPKNAV